MAYVDLNTIFNPAAGLAPPATWGDQIRDNFEALVNRPTCRVYNSANITPIPNNSRTALTFNSERYDNAAIHSTSSNTGRLTVPTGWAGVWAFFANIEWDGNATGVRQLEIRLNGSTLIAVFQESAPGAGAFQETISGQYKLAVGDYLEVTVFQTSGANRTINASSQFSPEFGMTWLSAG